MRLFLVVQVLVISLYRECPYARPSDPTDGVTEFHLLFLSLVRSQNVSASECLYY